MTSLSPEALAIIGGYHADPFRYLGRHDEGDAKSFAHSCPAPRRAYQPDVGDPLPVTGSTRSGD